MNIKTIVMNIKSNPQILLILLLTCFIHTTAMAVPTKEILEIFNKRLNAISTADTFKNMVTQNPEWFPVVNKENPLHAVSISEKLEIDKQTFTLMIGYRSAFIETNNNPKKQQFLIDLWSTPELFQKLYFLDGTSKVDGNFTKTDFKARVFKKIEGIENQDYTLHYLVNTKANWTFIRSRLDKDTNEFALRDHLKTLEVLPDGNLIVREITLFYPLRWYIQALGPAGRFMMKKEINKCSYIEKCLTEASAEFPPQEDVLKECMKKTKKL